MTATSSVQTHFETSQFQFNHPSNPSIEQGPKFPSYETANHWSKMSASYSQSGDQAAALDARQKAVEVYRLLHEKEPKLFEPCLACELLGLSKDLAGNGLIEEAFKASRESVMLYQHYFRESSFAQDITTEKQVLSGTIERIQSYWALVDPSTYLLKLARSLGRLRKSSIKVLLQII